MKFLASKILAVMNSIESVTKDGFNSFHKYKYVTDAAIVSEIRGAMIKYNLVCIPSQIKCDEIESLTVLLVKYTIIDADSGESMESLVYGYGQDNGDKGVYKAATGAEKYFLLKTFLLPTDDDAEKASPADEVSDEGFNTNVRVPADYWKMKDIDPAGAQERIGIGFYAKKTPKGWFIFSKEKITESPVQNTPPLAPETFIPHDFQLEIHRQAKERGMTLPTLKKGLKEGFGVDGTSKITTDQYPRVIEWIIKHESKDVGA